MRKIAIAVLLLFFHANLLAAPTTFNGTITFQGQFTFQPGVAPEPEGPTISNIVATVTSPTTVTISWDLSEAGTGEVEFGTTTAYGSSGGVEARFFTSHSQALEGFEPDTLYHFRVKSANALGYLSVSADGTFTTDALPAPPGTADLYVATTGNDTTGDGSSGNPWRTIQKAAQVATAGQTVSVAPGTYNERVNFDVNSGTAGNEIVFLAEDGVVIDGGTTINPAHWAASTAVGACASNAGVYEVTYAQLGFTPDNAVIWNGKTIGWLDDQWHASNGLGFMCTASGANAWLGVLAVAARKSSRLLVRFHDKTSPATQTVKVCPETGGTVKFNGVSYVRLENFTIQGCGIGVYVTAANTHHIRITNNTIKDGRNQVYVLTGAHDIEIDNNYMSVNYIYADVGHTRYRSTADENIFQLMRVKGNIWGCGVCLLNAGDSVTVHDNTIERTLSGIYPHITDPVDAAKNSNFLAYNNTINYSADYAIQLHQSNSVGMKIYNNTIHEAHHGIRFGPLYNMPVYVYGNKFSSETVCSQITNCTTPGDLAFSFFGQQPSAAGLWIYHNSLSGINCLPVNGGSLDNIFFVNNVMSCERLFSSPVAGNPDYFDYNWIGGLFGSQQGWMTGTHNIFSTNNRLWTNPPDFVVTGTAAENAGIRCDQANWLSGQSALPGCTADAAPNMGAIP